MEYTVMSVNRTEKIKVIKQKTKREQFKQIKMIMYIKKKIYNQTAKTYIVCMFLAQSQKRNYYFESEFAYKRGCVNLRRKFHVF